MKKKITALFLSLSLLGVMAGYSQSNAKGHLGKSTIVSSGSSEEITINNQVLIIQQSIGQTSLLGTTLTDEYAVSQGFLKPAVWADVIDFNIPINTNFQVFPNPFERQVTVSFLKTPNEAVKVYVYQVSGAVVYEEHFLPKKDLVLNLSSLSSGIFLLKIIASNQQFVKQLQKK